MRRTSVGRLSTGRFDINNPKIKEQVENPKYKYIDALGVGFGCTTIKKNVFKQILIPSVKLWENFETEDYPYCEIAKAKGYRTIYLKDKDCIAYHYETDKNGFLVRY